MLKKLRITIQRLVNHRWWSKGKVLTAITEMASMVLWLVVHSHVICDVSSRQELAADVAGDPLLVANHVGTQAVLCGKAGLTGLNVWRTRINDGLPVHLHLLEIEVVCEKDIFRGHLEFKIWYSTVQFVNQMLEMACANEEILIISHNRIYFHNCPFLLIN